LVVPVGGFGELSIVRTADGTDAHTIDDFVFRIAIINLMGVELVVTARTI